MPRSRRPSDRDFARLTRSRVSDMEALSGRLSRGKIEVDEWADAFHSILVRGHTDAHLLGRQRSGDLSDETEDDARFGLDAADGQDEFLQGFLEQLRDKDPRYFDEDGKLRKGPFDVRCRMYASRMRGTANQAFVDASEPDDLFDWERGATDSCADCIELASLSPYTQDTIISQPGDGHTECKVNCDCRLKRRRDGVRGFARVDVFDGDSRSGDGTTVSNMDTSLADLFSSPATVASSPRPEDLAAITTRLFGRDIPPEEIARMVAAPNGSKVRIRIDGERLKVGVSNTDLQLTFDRTFRLDDDGRVFAFHDFTEILKAPKGSGSLVFGRTVDEYEKVGIVRIENDAAGHPGDRTFNGYYTWPRLGYNMRLDARARKSAADEGYDVDDLNHLMLYGEEAARWWRDVAGYPGTMVFDMAPNSLSRRILRAYLTSNSIGL